MYSIYIYIIYIYILYIYMHICIYIYINTEGLEREIELGQYDSPKRTSNDDQAQRNKRQLRTTLRMGHAYNLYCIHIRIYIHIYICNYSLNKTSIDNLEIVSGGKRSLESSTCRSSLAMEVIYRRPSSPLHVRTYCIRHKM